MLFVVSGQRRYSWNIFNGKTFRVSKNLQKLQKFFPLNDLMYTVYCLLIGFTFFILGALHCYYIHTLISLLVATAFLGHATFLYPRCFRLPLYS